MTSLPDSVLGDAYASNFAWDLLEDLVEIGDRMAGHDGEHESAQIVAAAFEKAGVENVEMNKFEIPGWWRESSALSVDGHANYERDHHVIALPGSPDETVEAPIVDVGYGVPETIGDEVDGAITMVRSDVPEDHRWVHRMEKYAAAVRAGAKGFVFRNHVPGQLPPTGEVGYHDRPAPIPAVGVSKEVGARLERYVDENATTELSVACRNEPTTSVNTHAVLGPETEKEVVMTAHVDAHDIAEGAEDNGVGSVLLPEVARILCGVTDRLDMRVRFVLFGAEEIGLHGSYHYAASAGDLTQVVVNIDGAGRSRDPGVRTHGFDELEEPFRTVAERFDAPLEVDPGTIVGTDAWPFLERGIPAVTLYSQSEGDDRGWGHTHADTLEKLDPRDLRALAALFSAFVLELAGGDRKYDRKSPEAIRETLTDGDVLALEVGDRWHFD